MFFILSNEGTLYMAGLYDMRDGKSCYCILTTVANQSMGQTHNRMSLVLRKEQIAPWLNNPQVAFGILPRQPPQLAQTAADAQFRLW